MIILSETKCQAREAKSVEVFKNLAELRTYLENAKIYHVTVEGIDVTSGFESGGMVEFQYGGSTLLFQKGDWWVRIVFLKFKACRFGKAPTMCSFLPNGALRSELTVSRNDHSG